MSETPTDHEVYDDQFEYKRKIVPAGMFEDGAEVAAESVDGSVYAGKWARGQMDVNEQVTFGYMKDDLKRLTPASIPNGVFNRHTVISGDSGHGKSTVLQNILRQLVVDGDGGLFIDSKGDTATSLLQMLPDDELDDVVLVGSGYDGESGVRRGDQQQLASLFTPAFDDQTEADMDVFVDTVDSFTSENWGSKMGRFFHTLLRGVFHLDGYDVDDLATIVSDSEARATFVEDAESHIEDDVVLVDAIQTVCEEADEDDFEPLARRLQLLSGAGEEFFDSDGVNLGEAVADGKLVIIQASTDSEDVARAAAGLALARAWSIRRLQSRRESESPGPFTIAVSEFDSLYRGGGDLYADILSRGRSLNVRVVASVQGYDQLSTSTVATLFGNVATHVWFRPKNSDDANTITRNVTGLGSKELLNLPQFEAYVHTTVDGEATDPFHINTFPAYPPLRSASNALDSLPD